MQLYDIGAGGAAQPATGQVVQWLSHGTGAGLQYIMSKVFSFHLFYHHDNHMVTGYMPYGTKKHIVVKSFLGFENFILPGERCDTVLNTFL